MMLKKKANLETTLILVQLCPEIANVSAFFIGESLKYYSSRRTCKCNERNINELFFSTHIQPLISLQSLPRHLIFTYAPRHFLRAIIDLFFKKAYGGLAMTLPRLLPARTALVTRSIHNNGVTPEQASSRDSCKSASAFRLCNYRGAKLIRRRRSQFVSRRRRSGSQRAPLSSRSRVARMTRSTSERYNRIA